MGVGPVVRLNKNKDTCNFKENGVLYREQNSLKTELLDYGKHNSYGNEKAIHIRGPRPHTAP